MRPTSVEREALCLLLLDRFLHRDQLRVRVRLLEFPCCRGAAMRRHPPEPKGEQARAHAPRNRWCTASAPTIHLSAYCSATHSRPLRTHTAGERAVRRERTHRTGPSSSSFAFVASSSGVEARTQTSPPRRRTAVERPPTGKRLKRENGLREGNEG